MTDKVMKVNIALDQEEAEKLNFIKKNNKLSAAKIFKAMLDTTPETTIFRIKFKKDERFFNHEKKPAGGD